MRDKEEEEKGARVSGARVSGARNGSESKEVQTRGGGEGWRGMRRRGPHHRAFMAGPALEGPVLRATLSEGLCMHCHSVFRWTLGSGWYNDLQCLTEGTREVKELAQSHTALTGRANI